MKPSFALALLAALVSGCAEDGTPQPTLPSVEPPADGTAPEIATTPRAGRADDWFEDVAASGVDFVYKNGREGGHYTILESVGGGVGLVDFDRDGDLDLFFPGGGTIDAKSAVPRGLPSKLYRNDGDWQFVDVTAAAGLDGPIDYSHGCTIGDYNRDGFPDLFVTCFGRSRLYRNECNGHFTDVTESAGLQCDGWSTAAAWADVDHDGFPDLFVTGYVQYSPRPGEICRFGSNDQRDVCPPQQYPPAADRLFRNRGDGTFEDITQSIGLRDDGKGLGVIAADLNADGWVDFYVANDQVANHLYFGGPDRPLREVALQAGVSGNEFGAAEGSMGTDVADLDNDGLPELWVTNYEWEDNSLYRNLGNRRFLHTTFAFGLGGSGRPFVGFGTGLADFDGDARADLVVVNGHVLYHQGLHPFTQRPLLYRGRKRRFTSIIDRGGPWFSVPHAARGMALGDLDNDGATDMVVVCQNEPAALLRNRHRVDRWVRIELVGTHCDPRAVGATVTLECGAHRETRFAKSGAGYLSQFDPRHLFVLPTAAEPRIIVRWPGGGREVFTDLRPGCTNRVVQGEGRDVTQ